MKPTILIIDDHVAMRRTLLELVRAKFPHTHVSAAGDGAEGFALALETAPDIAIVDLELREMSGVDTARRIKTHAPRTRVVMLSMYDDAIFRDMAKRAGADACVSKMGAFSELPPALRDLLDGRRE